METLQAIEQLGMVRLLKASFFAYPVVNAIHIAAIGALLTSVTLIDLRILGTFVSLPESPFVALLRRLALLAFGFAVLSGLLLFFWCAPRTMRCCRYFSPRWASSA